MVKIKINDKIVQAHKWETVLQAAKRAGFEIPALCYHPSLKADGFCRLCLVEVTKGGKTKIDTACTVPVKEGMEVNLDTPEVVKHRKNILEMLIAQVPDSPVLTELAAKDGLKDVKLAKGEDVCIKCGLCVRICRERIGADALAMQGRGPDVTFTPPFGEAPESCVGCGACAFICPVQCIDYENNFADIKIWGKTFEKAVCSECGMPLEHTSEHIELMKSRHEIIKDEDVLVCEKCSRKNTLETMKNIVDGQLTFKKLGR
ncbi:MAG: 2Fe-2S iron-sulfur cluster-binding protein [Myxococcota bacterium]